MTNATIEPGMMVTVAKSQLAFHQAGREVLPDDDDDQRSNGHCNSVEIDCVNMLPQALEHTEKIAGILSTFMPKKSLNCDRAMSTAMPLVKLMTTDTGMKRESEK